MLMNTQEYLSVIENIKQEIKNAQYRATIHANSDLLLLYYDIGTVINEYKTWGINLLIIFLMIFRWLFQREKRIPSET